MNRKFVLLQHIIKVFIAHYGYLHRFARVSMQIWSDSMWMHQMLLLSLHTPLELHPSGL